jgi:hypothetical protein
MTVRYDLDRPSGTGAGSYPAQLPSSELLGYYRAPLRGKTFICLITYINTRRYTSSRE